MKKLNLMWVIGIFCLINPISVLSMGNNWTFGNGDISSIFNTPTNFDKTFLENQTGFERYSQYLDASPYMETTGISEQPQFMFATNIRVNQSNCTALEGASEVGDCSFCFPISGANGDSRVCVGINDNSTWIGEFNSGFITQPVYYNFSSDFSCLRIATDGLTYWTWVNGQLLRTEAFETFADSFTKLWFGSPNSVPFYPEFNYNFTWDFKSFNWTNDPLVNVTDGNCSFHEAVIVIPPVIAEAEIDISSAGDSIIKISIAIILIAAIIPLIRYQYKKR